MDHFFHRIQGWFNFRSVYHDIAESIPDGAHIVEVGAWKGCSAAYMAVELINRGKHHVKFDVVDTWLGSDEHEYDPYMAQGTLYEHFLDNMKPVEGHYRALRMTSREAAALYEDLSLDFVLIDAAHDYVNVKNDILAWLPKVKRGCILAGDDYPWLGVAQAVDELIPERTIVPPGTWVYRRP